MKRGRPGTALVADTFHPSLVARAIRRFSQKAPERHWFQLAHKLFCLELGRHRARSVMQKQPDPVPDAHLGAGASLIASRFDLPKVYSQCERLVSAGLPAQVLRTHVKPVGAPTLCVIYVEADETIEHRFSFGQLPRTSPQRLLRQISPELAAKILTDSRL